MPKRLAPAYLAALLLACGPESPDSAITDSTTANGPPETTTATTTAIAVTTSSTDPTTGTSTNPTMTEDTSGTSTNPTMAEDTSGTTAVGPCVADPASGTCSEGCDALLDCCKCDGQEFFPDPRASDCTLAMGIVTAYCPWGVWNLIWDDEWVLQVGDADECAVTETGWYQTEENGDRIIQLCGQACTDYLAGEFTVIKGEMFCEAA